MTAKSVAEKTRIKPDATVAVINPIAGIGGSPGLPAGVRFVPITTGRLVFLFVPGA